MLAAVLKSGEPLDTLFRYANLRPPQSRRQISSMALKEKNRQCRVKLGVGNGLSKKNSSS
jgi:hypothetical protein